MADLTQQPAAESQLTSYKDFQISNLKKTRPDASILEDGIENSEWKKSWLY